MLPRVQKQMGDGTEQTEGTGTHFGGGHSLWGRGRSGKASPRLRYQLETNRGEGTPSRGISKCKVSEGYSEKGRRPEGPSANAQEAQECGCWCKPLVEGDENSMI